MQTKKVGCATFSLFTEKKKKKGTIKSKMQRKQGEKSEGLKRQQLSSIFSAEKKKIFLCYFHKIRIYSDEPHHLQMEQRTS